MFLVCTSKTLLLFFSIDALPFLCKEKIPVKSIQDHFAERMVRSLVTPKTRCAAYESFFIHFENVPLFEGNAAKLLIFVILFSLSPAAFSFF